MTIQECVKEYMNEWMPGDQHYGYEICDAVKSRMWDAEHKRPLESTILRRVRELAPSHGIKSVNRTSKYMKVGLL